MEKKCVRSTRLRIKPLQYWNNERIRYNINGDILVIEAPPSSLMPSLTSQPKLSGLKTTVIHDSKRMQNLNGKHVFNAKYSSSSSDIPEVAKEKTRTKKKGSNLSNKVDKTKSLTENVHIHCKKPRHINNKTPLNKIQSTSVLKKDGRKIPQPSLSESATDHMPPENAAKSSFYRKQQKLFKIINPLDKNLTSLPRIPDEDDPNGEEKNGCHEYQPPIDISKLKIEEPGQCIFQLQGMFKRFTEHDEPYFVEGGPCDSTTGLCTGFIFTKSPTLYWGKITFPREIVVIEGDGAVEFTAMATGDLHSQRLFKGANYEIFPGGDLLLRKDENCVVLKLFVIFTYMNDGGCLVAEN